MRSFPRFSRVSKVADLSAAVATVRQELEAEIQHSKSIQAKLKTAPAASAPGSSLSLAQQKLQEDFDELKVRADLVEDLTGFSVITSKRENGETTFNCILNDLHGRLGGAFFLSLSSFVPHSATVESRPQLQALLHRRWVGVLLPRRERRARPGSLRSPSLSIHHVHEVRSSLPLRLIARSLSLDQV